MRPRRKRNISSARPAVKPVPQRSCVACRSVRPKRELVRLVRAGDPLTCHTGRSEESRGGAKIEIDATGRAAGRGAYLCRDRACWEKALKGTGLEKALRCSLTRENRGQLMQAGQKMLEELTSG